MRKLWPFEVCCYVLEFWNQRLQPSASILTDQMVELALELSLFYVALDVSFQLALESLNSEVYSSRYGL